MWIRLLFLLPAFLIALWPTWGMAEGSCSWADVTPILDGQPGLRRFLEDSFTLSPGGSAMRLGKQFESLEGRRVGPYRFDATSRKDSTLTFELVIETKPEFIDEAGTLLPVGGETRGVVVREHFTAIRLEPITDELAPAETMTEPLAAERTAWTQARCNQIHLADHQINTLDFPVGGKVTGKAIYHHDPLTNGLVYFTVDATHTDGASVSESFYFNEGELIFLLRRLPAPSGTQPGSEFRYYLQNGHIFKATRKAILPPGTAAPAVMEEPIPVPAQDSTRLLVRVSRLALETDPVNIAADYTAFLGVPLQ